MHRKNGFKTVGNRRANYEQISEGTWGQLNWPHAQFMSRFHWFQAAYGTGLWEKQYYIVNWSQKSLETLKSFSMSKVLSTLKWHQRRSNLYHDLLGSVMKNFNIRCYPVPIGVQNGKSNSFFEHRRNFHIVFWNAVYGHITTNSDTIWSNSKLRQTRNKNELFLTIGIDTCNPLIDWLID